MKFATLLGCHGFRLIKFVLTSDHFCPIIINSDHWFQGRCLKFLTEVHKGSWQRPLAAMFFMDRIRLSYFCSHLVTISAKLLLVTNFKLLGNWPRPMAAKSFDGSNLFSFFCRRSSIHHFYQIILKAIKNATDTNFIISYI